MRRNNEEEQELFSSEIAMLNHDYLNHVRFHYHWPKNKTPSYLVTKIKYSLGYIKAKKVRIGFIFKSDLEKGKAFVLENNKFIDKYNYGIILDDAFSNEKLLREIIKTVNMFYDKLLKLELDMTKDVPNVIWPQNGLNESEEKNEI